MKLRTVGLAAGGVVAAYAAERLLIGRPRAKLDPSVVDGFDYPPGAKHLDVPLSDGGSLHVVDVGSGRPIVLLHGITLSAMTWHYQLADLAGAYRVLAVDHRGHGTSTPGSGAWDIDRLALDLVELLDDLDLHGAVLVGHSMGGMVVLQAALDHADLVRRRIKGLVLMSTSGGPVVQLAAWNAVTEALVPSLTQAMNLGDRLPGGMFGANDLSYLVFRLGMGRAASAEHVEFNRRMTASTPVSVWGALLSGVAGFDVRSRLHEVDLPAMVMVGTRDVLTPPSSARQLVASLATSEPLRGFPGAGHMLMLERRRQVSEAIRDFVERHP